MLDRTAYPHLFDLVFEHAQPRALLQLRRVSRDVQALVDDRLFRHVVVHAADGQLTPDTLVSLRTADGTALPLPQRNVAWWDGASDPDEEQEEELEVIALRLSLTRVLDVSGLIPDTFTRWFDAMLEPLGTDTQRRITRVLPSDDGTMMELLYPSSHILVRFAAVHAPRPGEDLYLDRMLSCRPLQKGIDTVVQYFRISTLDAAGADFDMVPGVRFTRADPSPRVYYTVLERPGLSRSQLDDSPMSWLGFAHVISQRIRNGGKCVLVGFLDALHAKAAVQTLPSEIARMTRMAARLPPDSDQARRLVKFMTRSQFESLWSAEELLAIMPPPRQGDGRTAGSSDPSPAGTASAPAGSSVPAPDANTAST